MLVPALVGFPLSVFGLATGLDVLQGLQALVMSLAAVPVYLWGRSLVSRGWALAAAALAVAVPGLTYAGLMMSEVLFIRCSCSRRGPWPRRSPGRPG